MKYILLAVMLFTAQASAGGMLNIQLRNSDEMSERCVTNINYFNGKLYNYSLKLRLSAGEKIKSHYYESELESWQDYCYGDGADPVFTED